MKNLFSLLVLVSISATFVYSQERNDELDSVYVQSSAATLEVDYNNFYQGAKKYEGVVGYIFTVTNYSDTINAIYLEGGYDGSIYVRVDSIIKATNGNYALYDENPVFLKYRLNVPLSAGDTCTVNNVIYYQK